MAAATDITGLRFGKLVAISQVVSEGHSRWLFRCDCGRDKEIRKSHVCTGAISSCGCIVRRRDGWSQTRIMHIWRGMMSRCTNPASDKWLRYGGRGITVCQHWHDFTTFRLWAESNGYSDDLEIDRADNDGNYDPANCHFVTHLHNTRNRSVTRVLDMDGKTVPLAQAAEDLGLTYSCLKSRMDRGETGEGVFRLTSRTIFFDEPLTYAEAEARYGVKERTIRDRIRRGMTPDQAITARKGKHLSNAVRDWSNSIAKR